VDDTTLIEQFEAGLEPPGGFHHREHVRVAWFYLQRHAFPQALTRFSENLRKFATAQGKPGLYHETITVAFVLIINERLDGPDRDLPFDQFASRHPDLLSWRPSVLDRYYSADTLTSERARRIFVMPDHVGVDSVK
jgi:hypothetical protein